MQILREALLQKLSTNIILFKVLRNKILSLTQYQLVLLNIDEGCKKVQIPYSGTNVRTIQISKDYIAILERSGALEIRKIDNIKEVLFTQNNVKIPSQHYPKLKWWQDHLHIVYEHHFDQISLTNKLLTSHPLPFSLNRSQTLLQLEFSDLFPDLKCIFHVMTHSIHLSLDGFQLGLIQFQDQQIKQVLRLSHPLQSTEFKKQYLVVLTETLEERKESRKCFLRVFNILNMREIFCKELYKQKDESIEICCDQLCEYLLVKYFKGKLSSTNIIQSQNLMKVNGDYYYSEQGNWFESHQSFFKFDIPIGLTKNLRLFPSHSEKIKGTLCHSIDTCYYDKNEIFIASIVLEASYKDQIFHHHHSLTHVIDLETLHSPHPDSDLFIWKQLVQAKISPKTLIDQITQSISLTSSSKPELENSFSVELAAQQEKIIQKLLSSLNRINQFNSHDFNKAYLTLKKIMAIEYFPMLMDVGSIQRNQNKTVREILQKSNSDFVNTMSGFSSSQSHSPRSIKSEESQNKMGNLLKDISNDFSQRGSDNFCRQCEEIEDHENLLLIEQIEEQSSMGAAKSLLRIEEQIEKMESLCRYRMEKMEMKTRHDKKEEGKVAEVIESEFKRSLKEIEWKLLSSAREFSAKFAAGCDGQCGKEFGVSQYGEKLQERRMGYENELRIRKENGEELLDYLYDIEFPQVERDGSRDWNEKVMDSRGGRVGKEERDDLKLFSELIMKNLI